MVVVIVVAILVVDEGVPVKKFSFWNNTNAKCVPIQKYFWMETRGEILLVTGRTKYNLIVNIHSKHLPFELFR